MKPSEGTMLLLQGHDPRVCRDRAQPTPRRQGPWRYAAAVPAHALDEQGCLIDQLICFVFDTLGVQHLDLRVYEAK